MTVINAIFILLMTTVVAIYREVKTIPSQINNCKDWEDEV